MTINNIYKYKIFMLLDSDNDVVDGDVNELDEEADEAHDGKADGGGHGNLLELFPVRLRASLHQPAYQDVRKNINDNNIGCSLFVLQLTFQYNGNKK
jgi:hypothetical protein